MPVVGAICKTGSHWVFRHLVTVLLVLLQAANVDITNNMGTLTITDMSVQTPDVAVQHLKEGNYEL